MLKSSEGGPCAVGSSDVVFLPVCLALKPELMGGNQSCVSNK